MKSRKSIYSLNDPDKCCICGKEINLALPHDYDREKQRPKHRDCEKDSAEYSQKN